jgi:hypothetical protein
VTLIHGTLHQNAKNMRRERSNTRTTRPIRQTAKSPPTQPPLHHDLKTTPRKFGKERNLKNDCIVNIILSNELRAIAPPETMF